MYFAPTGLTGMLLRRIVEGLPVFCTVAQVCHDKLFLAGPFSIFSSFWQSQILGYHQKNFTSEIEMVMAGIFNFLHLTKTSSTSRTEVREVREIYKLHEVSPESS